MNMSPPTSKSENKPGVTSVKAGDKQSFAFLAYSSTLKMVATSSSKTSVDFKGVHGVISQKIELLKIYSLFILRSSVFWDRRS
jgi:hypothetical protein